jgi:steroid delta-isomerase-like uncharacterized protein
VSEENKAIVRRFLQMFELGDPGMADEIVATDYYNHDAPDPNIGLDGLKTLVTGFRNALPDVHFDILYQVAEGDIVVSRYKTSGTHRSEYFGVPATGKRVIWTTTFMVRIANGKIREAMGNWDQWGLMQQLGVIQPPGG